MCYLKDDFRQANGAALPEAEPRFHSARYGAGRHEEVRLGYVSRRRFCLPAGFAHARREVIFWKNYNGVLNFVITRFARKQNWHESSGLG